MSEWLYEQAVSSAADRAAAAHLSYLGLGLAAADVLSLEDIIRDMLRTDPLPCQGVQHRGGREISFEWSFGYEDVPVIVAVAEEYVRISLDGTT